MKATREQCLAMASNVGLTPHENDEVTQRILERLVHLAQQFTLDQLRAIGGIEIRWRDGTSESLYRVPETLE